MRDKPAALGYLRTDVSGVRQQWDEAQIRSRAARLGYSLCKTVAFSARTRQPIRRLAEVVETTRAEVVIAPGPEHFDGRIPAEIVRLADVITVEPDATYARWANGELPEL